MSFFKNIWEKFRALKTWQKIVVVVLVLALGSAAGGGTSTSSSSSSGSTEAKKVVAEKEKMPAIGQTVADGKFAFKVFAIKCGAKTAGSGFMTSTAQGVYCVMDLGVKNIGKEAQTLFSDNMKLIDSSGAEYQSDSTAMVATNQTDLWLKEINPGITVSGKIYFDVPQGMKPTVAELHDSVFSGGVKVDLTRTVTEYNEHGLVQK